MGKTKAKRRSTTLSAAFTPFNISETLVPVGQEVADTVYRATDDISKRATDAFNYSLGAFDEGKKNMYDLGRRSKLVAKKSIKKSRRFAKDLVSDIPNTRNARAFMDLLKPINDRWMPKSITISGHIYARGVEMFMMRYEQPGSKHIISERAINAVHKLLTLDLDPGSFSHIPHDLTLIFSNQASVNETTVFEMLHILFSEYIQMDSAYKGNTSTRSEEVSGMGWDMTRMRKHEEKISKELRKNVLIKLKANHKKQEKYLHDYNITRKNEPTAGYFLGELQKMKVLLREAVKDIDTYKEETMLTDADKDIVYMYNEYVMPLINKFPELNLDGPRGASKKMSSKKMQSPKKKKQSAKKAPKKKKKAKKKQSAKRNFWGY
tara:strand:- start:5708 stop:6841 length:1134 start_codon:yes stop_codon:yes gene_type:complete